MKVACIGLCMWVIFVGLWLCGMYNVGASSAVGNAMNSFPPTQPPALSPTSSSVSPCSVSAFFSSPPPLSSSSSSFPVDSSAGLNVRVDAWGDDTARIRISPTAIIEVPSPQALTALPPPSSSLSFCIPTPLSSSSSSPSRTDASSTPLRATYGNLHVEVSLSGFVSVSRVSPPQLLLSTSSLSFRPYPWSSTFYPPTYPSYHSIDWSFVQPNGSTHGLGEHHHGRESLAYWDFSIEFDFPETAALKGDVMIPWTLHSTGLGTLWNQPGWGSYSISKGTNVTWTADQTPQFDVLFTTTPSNWTRARGYTPYEPILQNLLTATASYPKPLPHYASGFWQCKLRYRSQQEVIDAAMGYVNRSLPLSVIVIDYKSWLNLGDFSFDPNCFPDPSAMVRQLRDVGVEVMVSMWPHAGALSKNFAYMKSHDLLTHNSTGQFLNESIPWMPWPPGPQPEASAVDFLAPAAQAYVSKLLLQNFIAHGIRMLWLDADEPDCSVPGQQWWNGRPDVEIVSVYPLGVIKTVKDAFDAANVTDGLMLSRDTWIGGAPMGAAVWSGDIVSEFSELRRQVLVSQNVALSGIYHWTTDVGGFFNGVLGNATFEELAVSFCPIFRTHGDRSPSLPDDQCGSTGGHTEVWYFQFASIIESLLRLREALRPYVEHHLRMASVNGRPLLQPMFYAFNDSSTYEAEEQFMCGPEYLVAPVLEEHATQRRVYLPVITQQAADRMTESWKAVGSVRGMKGGREAIERAEVVGGSEGVHETDGYDRYEVLMPELNGEEVVDVASLKWRHFYSGVEYEGGQWVTVNANLTDFPLFQLAHTNGTLHIPLSSTPVAMSE